MTNDPKVPIVEVSNLTKVFDGFIAVDHISFSLYPGEIVGLLGPNGTGKTTTLQMLLGTLTPTGGSVKIFGLDLNKYRQTILGRINFSSTDLFCCPQKENAYILR